MNFKKYVLDSVEDTDPIFIYLSAKDLNYVTSVQDIPDEVDDQPVKYRFTTGENYDIDVYSDPYKDHVYIMITTAVEPVQESLFTEEDIIPEDFMEYDQLDEDTVKRGNHWVNKGKEGTHGKFRTKKAADAQRKAMFANGYITEDAQLDDADTDITQTPFYINYLSRNSGIISKEDLNKIVASGLYDIIDFNTPYPAGDYELSKFKVINPDKVRLTFETEFIAQDLDDYKEASDIDAAAYGLSRFINDTELDPHITNIELLDNNFDTMALMFTADEDFPNPGKYLFELSAHCMDASIFDQDGPYGENYAEYDSDIEVEITVDISREN